MKKQFVAAGFVLFSFMLPLKANAAQFGAMYVFGDSLSDTGNIFNATGGAYPQSSLYSSVFPGRFSNGQIWVDYLADQLKITQPTLVTDPKFPNGGVNFAFGGARAGFGNAVVPDPPGQHLPGVLEQVQGFAANNPKADPNALYTVWGGANDFIFPPNPNDSTPPADRISQALNTLVAVGAKNILVFNLPDLSKVPLFQGTAPQSVHDAVDQYNTTLKQTLDGLSNNPNLNIISVDTYSLFDQVSKSPGTFGFTNVANSCRVQTSQTTYEFCSNPNQYLFWDEVHPTTAAQKLIADRALAAIEAKSVPEPSTALGTLAIGAWGAAAVLKRKRKKLLVTTANQVPAGQSTRTKVES
ncbi:MAG: SGNH/GDSL hydrolase family protein [Aulosira sp. ZfuVER01]|nr:SGNH/GDSL hydrolase family protein [Aulosira sp. ZfuVER01]MDZ7999906.1 SGNH/GDSL hydrolase family protein [Aulosira sp. DedVER01a]MDZ8051343.1 SGNH/GDSL hydrolase family protein [Aulosira sp. ZfuCHP01]